MSIYDIMNFSEAVAGNRYPGRGIVVGKTADGTKACAAYFIMGRSANSRNRVFSVDKGTVLTKPFDESKVEDPSLIIYNAIRQYENKLIVTNGNQTDTAFDGLSEGLNFHKALALRQFEPDAPNLTPRISSVLVFDEDMADFTYSMSILKSADAEGTACNRYGYDYTAVDGLGHFIHTYQCDGNPLPTFQGEPRRVAVPDCIDEFADEIWNSLDEENKISLYVRYIDLSTGEYEERLFNKNN